jgi:hypothetical protein
LLAPRIADIVAGVMDSPIVSKTAVFALWAWVAGGGIACSSLQLGAAGIGEAPQVGRSSTTIEGCLNRDKSSSRRSKPPVSPQAGAEVRPIPGGVVVTHNLIHACCLQAEVTSSIEREVATVREHLTGEACKCDCASTLETALGLTPGDWIVRLLLDTPSAPAQIVQDWDVKVRPR